MISRIKSIFSGLGQDVLEGLRMNAQQHMDDAAFEERVIGIENATAAMLEVGIDEKLIVQMLQKYWDLRLSEAEEFINRQKEIEKQ